MIVTLKLVSKDAPPSISLWAGNFEGLFAYPSAFEPACGKAAHLPGIFLRHGIPLFFSLFR